MKEIRIYIYIHLYRLMQYIQNKIRNLYISMQNWLNKIHIYTYINIFILIFYYFIIRTSIWSPNFLKNVTSVTDMEACLKNFQTRLHGNRSLRIEIWTKFLRQWRVYDKVNILYRSFWLSIVFSHSTFLRFELLITSTNVSDRKNAFSDYS